MTTSQHPQIAEDLRRGIESGILAPGAKLDSERTLAERYGVARTTVREALKVLRNEGLVVPRQGSGVYVSERRQMIRLSRNRLSRAERARTGGTFAADMAALGLEPEVETEIILGEADAAVALALDIDEGSQVLARRRKMYGSGTSMQLATSYFPAELVRGTQIEQQNTGHGGVYARLEEMGHRLVTPFVERISTRAPTRTERDWFRFTNGTGLLVLTRIARTAERPVEVNLMIMRGDRYELEYEIAAD